MLSKSKANKSKLLTININLEQQIYTALKSKNFGNIKGLLKQGLDPNSMVNGYPLIIIAILKGAIELVRILLQFNANVNVVMPGYNYYTPLYIAVRFNHYKILEILIEYGAILFPEYQSNLGSTLLHTAVMHKYIEITELLLNQKCNPNHYNIQQQTPLHVAVINYELALTKDTTSNIFIINKDLVLIKLLLNYRADLHLFDLNYKTPLMIALEHNNDLLVNLFSEYDTNIREFNSTYIDDERFFLTNFFSSINDCSSEEITEVNNQINSDQESPVQNKIDEDPNYEIADLTQLLYQLKLQ